MIGGGRLSAFLSRNKLSEDSANYKAQMKKNEFEEYARKELKEQRARKMNEEDNAKRRYYSEVIGDTELNLNERDIDLILQDEDELVNDGKDFENITDENIDAITQLAYSDDDDDLPTKTRSRPKTSLATVARATAAVKNKTKSRR